MENYLNNLYLSVIDLCTTFTLPSLEFLALIVPIYTAILAFGSNKHLESVLKESNKRQ